MKTFSTINVNKTLRNLLSLSAIFALLLVATAAKAGDNGDKIKTPGVEIKYLGTVDSKPIFKIEFDNQADEDVYLSLKDESGNTFYSEVVKDKKYSKRFQFENGDLDGMKVVLSVRSKGGSSTQVYEINKSVRQVEDVVIAKIQ